MQNHGTVNQNRARTENDSGGSAVPMMQAADLRNRYDSPVARRFHFSWDRRVAIQRKVSPLFVVVIKVIAQIPRRCRSVSTTT